MSEHAMDLRNGRCFTLRRKQVFPMSAEQAWAFFSSPRNLARITPGDMRFHILTESLPEEIHPGLVIKYTVRPLFGIPLGWHTLITDATRPGSFTDIQVSGPFAKWEHTHRFRSLSDGNVEMEDEVRYALPFGILGEWVHRLLVKRRVEAIFDYRSQKLNTLFCQT